MPDNLEASAWGCHAIGVAVLLACSHLQSVFAPPVVVLSDSNADTVVRVHVLLMQQKAFVFNLMMMYIASRYNVLFIPIFTVSFDKCPSTICVVR